MCDPSTAATCSARCADGFAGYPQKSCTRYLGNFTFVGCYEALCWLPGTKPSGGYESQPIEPQAKGPSKQRKANRPTTLNDQWQRWNYLDPFSRWPANINASGCNTRTSPATAAQCNVSCAEGFAWSAPYQNPNMTEGTIVVQCDGSGTFRIDYPNVCKANCEASARIGTIINYGWLAHMAPRYPDDEAPSTAPKPDMNDCCTFCKADTSCLSWTYNATSGVCELYYYYSEPVAVDDTSVFSGLRHDPTFRCYLNYSGLAPHINTSLCDTTNGPLTTYDCILSCLGGHDPEYSVGAACSEDGGIFDVFNHDFCSLYTCYTEDTYWDAKAFHPLTLPLDVNLTKCLTTEIPLSSLDCHAVCIDGYEGTVDVNCSSTRIFEFTSHCTELPYCSLDTATVPVGVDASSCDTSSTLLQARHCQLACDAASGYNSGSATATCGTPSGTFQITSTCQRTCSGFSCPAGILKLNPETIVCADTCGATQCCDETCASAVGSCIGGQHVNVTLAIDFATQRCDNQTHCWDICCQDTCATILPSGQCPTNMAPKTGVVFSDTACSSSLTCEDACCDLTCSSFTCVAATEGLLKSSPETIVCSGGVCDATQCCDKTCQSGLTSGTCPTNYIANPSVAFDTTLCASLTACTATCCQATCASHTCTSGLLKDGAVDIICSNGACDDSQCCDGTCQSIFQGSVCPLGHDVHDTATFATTRCTNTSNCLDVCCHETCASMLLSGCPTNFLNTTGVDWGTTDCVSQITCQGLCCQASCGGYSCSYGVLKTDAASIACSSGVCDAPQCCETTCTTVLANGQCPTSMIPKTGVDFATTICTTDLACQTACCETPSPVTTCDEFTCTAGVLKTGFTCTGNCDATQCCADTCQTLLSNGCPAGMASKPDVTFATTLCDTEPTCQSTCCQASCSTVVCTAGVKRTDADSVVCTGPSCTPGECCSETCQTILLGECPQSHDMIPDLNMAITPCTDFSNCLDTCCRDTCATVLTDGQCPSNYLAKAGVQFNETDCTTNTECLSLCCQATCGSMSCTPAIAKTDAATTLCTDGRCTASQCCDDTCQSILGDTCGSGWTKLANVDFATTLCADETACLQTCCEASTEPATCASFTCTSGILKETPGSITCENNRCSATQCCDDTCTSVLLGQCASGHVAKVGVDFSTTRCGDVEQCLDLCCHDSCNSMLPNGECPRGYLPKPGVDFNTECESQLDCQDMCCQTACSSIRTPDCPTGMKRINHASSQLCTACTAECCETVSTSYEQHTQPSATDALASLPTTFSTSSVTVAGEVKILQVVSGGLLPPQTQNGTSLLIDDTGENVQYVVAVMVPLEQAEDVNVTLPEL